MPTPDATAALLSGAAEINNHFSEPPFQYQELKKAGVRRILKSYDVLGGKTTFDEGQSMQPNFVRQVSPRQL